MLIAYFYHQAQQMAKQNPNLTLNKANICLEGFLGFLLLLERQSVAASLS